MTDDFISIGKITSTFGLKGSLKVASSGDILSSLSTGTNIFIPFEQEFKSFKLLSIRSEKSLFVLTLSGIHSIENAEKLRGKLLYFPKNESKSLLAADEFYAHQLIGLYPYFEDKDYQEFKLKEVLDNPVHPILLFSDGEKEILVPYINKFVGQVNLEKGRIEILNWEDWLLAD